METAAEQQVEVQAEAQADEAVVKQDNQQKVGTDWVEPEALDPKVKERLDNIYKKMKKYEREAKDWREIDKQRQQVIVDLQNATHVVVDHLTSKSLSDSESQLKAKMQSALDAGDNAAYLDAQDKLIEVKAQKIAKQNTKPVQAQQPKQQKQEYISTREAVDEGFADGELSYEDNQYAKAWLGETNERGEALRPWAVTEDPEDPDPDHVKAMVIAQKLFTQPAYKNWTVEKKLAEIDKRMGVNKQQVQQNVMGGGLTGKSNAAKVTLTPKQREIALATKFGGPKAKSDADHIAAYEKAILRAKGAK